MTPVFYVTQALTAHREFASIIFAYYHKGFVFIKEDTCDYGALDTVEHFVLHCPQFEQREAGLQKLSRGLDWSRAVPAFVSTPQVLHTFENFCEVALTENMQQRLRPSRAEEN